MKRIPQFLIFVSLLMSVVVLLTPPRLRAQERTSAPTPNTVWVGADGKYEAEPDTAVVQFNISAQEDTLQAASDPRHESCGTSAPAAAHERP